MPESRAETRERSMPDIILPGSAGRIEARYQRQKAPARPWRWCCTPIPSSAAP